MDRLSISELKPELPELPLKQIRGTVTLIWPYSSSARQFAFLLGDPDFRLRRKHGQVRVRFSGSSARAVASTGVGIGDEVVLSLRGATFVRDSLVNTPGKSIDWELAYSQTLSAQIIRGDTHLADLDFVDVAPTPAPRSPVRPRASIESPHQWSSPAFLKRMRLSDIPHLRPAHDNLVDTDDIESENARKRRRHSYKDWNAWTYVGRTPSPDKEDAGMDHAVSADASPIRAIHLPDTPVSPIRAPASSGSGLPSMAGKEAIGPGLDEEAVSEHLQFSEPQDDIPQETLDDDLYDVPDGQSLMHRRSLSQDGTESDADEDETSVDSPENSHVDVTSLVDSEDHTTAHSRRGTSEVIELSSEADEAEGDAGAEFVADIGSLATHHIAETTFAEAATEEAGDLIDEVSVRRTRERSGTHDDPIVLGDSVDSVPQESMPPPPTLPLLHTDFQTTYKPGLLTPIGKEPSSPNLQPLDSSTLPMPSPFPGERDGNVTSYLDYVSSSQQPNQQFTTEGTEQERPDDEADYILETSFYSSVSSSKAPSAFPTHESAFTDVRFTFGMDGATFSRPHTSSGVENAFSLPPISDEKAHDVDHSNAEEVRFSSPIPADRGAGDTLKTDDPSTGDPSTGLDPSQRGPTVTASATFLSSAARSAEAQTWLAETSDQEVPPVVESDHEMIHTPEQSHDFEITEHDDTSFPVGSGHHTPAIPEIIDLESSSNIEEEEETGSEGSKMDLDPDSKIGREQSQESDSMVELVDEVFPGLEKTHPEFEEESHSAAVPNASPLHGASHEEHEPETDINQSQDLLSIVGASDAGSVAEHSDQSPQRSYSSQQDVKIESLEETFSSFIDEEDGQAEDVVAPGAQPAKVFTTFREETIEDGSERASPPDTAPARNTRSKAQVASSPGKKILDSSPATRANKRSSLAPLSELPQRAVSPPATRSRSTASPTQQSFTTSPYSLRSQSKHLSPTKPSPISGRKSVARRRSRQDRVSAEPSPLQESFTQDSTHTDGLDYQWTHFGPSQELGTLSASQGRFSDIHSIKDSEEGSMHSEQSLSTAQDTDDQSVDRNVDERVISDVQANASTPKPGKGRTRDQKAASPGMAVLSTGREVRATDDGEVPLTPSFTSQLFPSSPAKSVRSIAAASVASSTPRRSRRLNKGSEESTTAGETEALLVESPRTDRTKVAPGDQRPLLPETPEDTQVTLVNSQTSLIPMQEQTLPPTPQFTQSTSAAVRSLNTSYHADPDSAAAPGPEIMPDRNAPAMDVASPSASPEASTHSVSDEEVTAVEIEKPSIGLSTPMAYYTPLKDLPYFLNRSSAFHSAGSPDVLALVTTASTPPTQASKGPKHHNTTLHITDLSIYPAQTTVQIFRAYASALPVAETGDVVLLRGMSVKSLNRHPCLVSADESAWCVWRYGKPLWGKKRGAYGEVKSREEVNGPAVERGEGEWAEVEKLRAWYVDVVKGELEDKVKRTRSKDKQAEDSQLASQG